MMQRRHTSRTALVGLVFALAGLASSVCAPPLAAQIAISGVEDREVYTDDAAFDIDVEPDWDYTALLNGAPTRVGEAVSVLRPDYYELAVTRRHQTSGAEESATVRFIVRDSARGNSEWGLPSFVPLPRIPSARAEFAGASIELTAPAAIPAGLELPLAVRVVDGDGRRLGVNGTIAVSGSASGSIELLRGVGSTLLAGLPAGDLTLSLEVQGVSLPYDVRVEDATSWSDVAGTISSDTDWGADARVRVTGGLDVAASTTLTIGPGSIVLVAADVEIEVFGELVVDGTRSRPVVFAPESRSAPWGGILLRTGDSRAAISGAILTGSGADDDWFGNNSGSGSSHRDEQPLIYVSNGATAELVDCALIDNFGQAGHGEGSFLTLRRSLVQRCITVGQYNGGTVLVEDSALIEFPAENAPFEDEDNDGLYLTGGAHVLRDTLVGWALDDGLDAGSGSGGTVEVTGCWVESCYHEGMAWSESRLPTVTDSVAINCGQGIECGFGDPEVDAERCLSTANFVGARFGDNYDWDYDGFLDMRDSLLLYNRRDVWGQAWDDWSHHLSQMSVATNWLSAPNPVFPDNPIWQPETDAARLEPFLPTPATEVGIGIALREATFALGSSELDDGVPVGLSTFTTHVVSASWSLRAEGVEVASGDLVFPPGQTVERVSLELEDVASAGVVQVRIGSPTGAELTGLDEVTLLRDVVLVPRGAVWRYLDNRTDQGIEWREPAFDDSTWPSGPAQLGFGDDDEATEVAGGPDDDRTPTFYFRHRFPVTDPALYQSLEARLQRDDGGVVYVNGREVFRSNMPEGEITYATFSDDTTSSETAFFTQSVPLSALEPGENVVAVEVHQANDTSSDVSFDFELIARPRVPTGTIEPFRRGDANSDGQIDVSDPVRALIALFVAGGAELDCADAADANDDGDIDIADASSLLDYLFRAGATPPAPGPLGCGADLTEDTLDCAAGPCRP